MKRVASFILVLLLCCTALSETIYDFVVKTGYTPVSLNKRSNKSACYFEEKSDKSAITWTEDGSQYRIIDSSNKENMRALYTQLLTMKQWQCCQFIVNGKRLYGYNAPKSVINRCGSLEIYKSVLNYYIYGITPPPRPTATPRPTNTPIPTPRPTPKPSVKPNPTKKAKKAKLPKSNEQNYVLNTNTKRFHYPSCGDVQKIKDKNRQDVYRSRDEIINAGFKPCGHCKP